MSTTMLRSALSRHRLTSLLHQPHRTKVTEASFFLKRKVVLPSQPKRTTNLVVGPFIRDYPHNQVPRPLADYIYEEIEQPAPVDPKLKLILLQTIDELGVAGDIVEVDRDYGRFQLLSAGAAVYADEYNLNKYRSLIEEGGKDRSAPSSAFVMPTIKRLAHEVILVVVNDINTWTLSVDHIRIAFRAAGYIVPNEAITLPSTPINGPNVEAFQGKDIAVKIQINNKETVHVRCLIHHKGLPLRPDWNREPRFIALPEEQGELLKKMPAKEAVQEEDLI